MVQNLVFKLQFGIAWDRQNLANRMVSFNLFLNIKLNFCNYFEVASCHIKFNLLNKLPM